MADQRTPAEIAYDSLKDGSAYIKPQLTCLACGADGAPVTARYCDVCGAPMPPANPSPLLLDLVQWAQKEMEADEERGLDILLGKEATDDMIAILEEIDGGETEPAGKRFCDAVDWMFDLPDALRGRAVVMLEQFLAGGSLDERFDRAVDNLADLPEPRRAEGVSLVEGFLAGVKIANDAQRVQLEDELARKIAAGEDATAIAARLA